MFSLGSSHRYLLYRQPCDMRKSFDALSGIVSQELNRSAISGEVFIFLNKRRTHLKMLHWENGGFVLYYKRLEKGTFTPPVLEHDEAISWPDLVLMIEGIQVQKSIRKLRFSLEKNSVFS
ncbi:IS66 family insertion sequence element accessory protein TnpB [Arachidicoccus soli]|uniref:Transposase n=1 Tax=Arachidicoccus soli TaxID=2341117 RepID=A0A386HNI4_9BACT|nr:IS66 family insertion sequence element accessory protein TnpB [Arachidicoccus soli]AYD47375.1 transposase [Arachidicoccus soli]